MVKTVRTTIIGSCLKYLLISIYDVITEKRRVLLFLMKAPHLCQHWSCSERLLLRFLCSGLEEGVSLADVSLKERFSEQTQKRRNSEQIPLEDSKLLSRKRYKTAKFLSVHKNITLWKLSFVSPKQYGNNMNIIWICNNMEIPSFAMNFLHFLKRNPRWDLKNRGDKMPKGQFSKF